MKNTIYSILFLFLFLGINLFAQEEKLDKYPEPVGGIEAMIKNVVYPVSAKDAGVEGKVFVKVIIDEKGNVVHTKILNGIGGGCDEMAVDAIKQTKFNPGKQNDHPVKVQVTIPIMFKLD